ALKAKQNSTGSLTPAEQSELTYLEQDAQRLSEYEQRGESRPPLRIVVQCESPQQYLGIARHDLYIVGAEKGYALNFFKGAAGLWFQLCLVIGMAVTCSTYLSGVISWLATMFLFMTGLFLNYIQSLALDKEVGGGPFQSFIRLANQ